MHLETRVSCESGVDGCGHVRAVVVHHQMHIQLRRHIGIDGAQELQEFPGTMPAMQLADDAAGGDVQRRKQGRGAMSLVVVRAPLGMPGASGRMGCVRSSAWIWLFSSTHNTMAFTGGARYRPTMSRALSTNIGSVEIGHHQRPSRTSQEARSEGVAHVWCDSGAQGIGPLGNWRKPFQDRQQRSATVPSAVEPLGCDSGWDLRLATFVRLGTDVSGIRT